MSSLSNGVKYYIPGLPPNVEVDDLRRYFGVFGKVLSSEISRGAGHVCLSNDAPHSEIVAETHELGGKQLRALISKESLQAPDVKKVHLGRLGEYVTPDVIRSVLSQFGAVLDVHTPKDPHTGHRKNYGFATFESEEAFNNCIATGFIDIAGCNVQLRPANQTQVQPGEESAPSLRAKKESGIKYFVPGLPESVDDAQLRDHFSKCGEVIDVCVVIDKDSGVSRGFGYVTMMDASSQEAVLTGQHMLGGKPIQVQLTKDSLSGGGVKKVHLGDLREDVEADQIREVFSQFGLVVDVHTPKFPDSGRRKNFAFVTFSSEDAFRKAVHTGRVEIAGCSVTVKPAAQSLEDGEKHAGKSSGKGKGAGKDGWSAAKGGADWNGWGACDPYGKGKAAMWDTWMWYKGMGKGWDWWGPPFGKGDWSDWSGKGYGKSDWSMWGGKGDPWGKGDAWAKGGPWDASWLGGWDGGGCNGKGGKGNGKDFAWGGDSGKGGKDGWGMGSKGGKDAWCAGGKDAWTKSSGKGGDPWSSGKGDSWGCAKGVDSAWGKGDLAGGDGKGSRYNPYGKPF